jgi:hypothetical protein
MKLAGPPTRSFLVLFLALSLLFVDLIRLPENQFTVKALVFSIEKYREYVSPLLGNTVTCKFKLSCSSYAIMAFKKHGAFKGTKMIIVRLAKCSPLSSSHGEDYP